MQAINRIQNAIINANAAGIQGALVVDGANARRAYPSFKPCDMYPVSKSPVPMPSSVTPPHVVLESSRRWRTCLQTTHLTNGPAGGMWRHESHHLPLPATVWATLVLNRNLCG